MKELFTNTWRTANVTKVFNTDKKDGRIDNRVGDYVALSHDMSRCYYIAEDNSSITFNGYKVDMTPNDEIIDYMCGYVDSGYDHMVENFLTSCEEVFTFGTYEIYFECVVEAMMKMSKALNLGWVMKKGFCNIEVDCDVWRIYNAEMAQKMHIQDKCVFCYTELSAYRAIAEMQALGKDVRTSMKFETVMVAEEHDYVEYQAIVVYEARYQLYEMMETGERRYIYKKAQNGIPAQGYIISVSTNKASCFNYAEAKKLQMTYSHHNLILIDDTSEYFIKGV